MRTATIKLPPCLDGALAVHRFEPSAQGTTQVVDPDNPDGAPLTLTVVTGWTCAHCLLMVDDLEEIYGKDPAP